MNDAVRVSTEGLLTTAQLAALPDFTLGLALISPSTRTLAGPGGTADIEPRVMQVLVVLADSAGQVVTRETLFNRCWGGVYVGDDSLNRAVAAVRKLAADIAGNSFEIETIPRTGYRLVGATPSAIGGDDPAAPAGGRGLTRRQLAASALGVTAFAGLGYWGATRLASERRFESLLEQSEKALRNGTADQRTATLLQEAVAIHPASAKAWGMLAYLTSVFAFGADPKEKPGLIDKAESAARKALALDPKEPNALLAMFELEGSTLDWLPRDRRLRQILGTDPNNIGAIAELVLLLQAAGMSRESWDWNEKALRLQPLSMDFLSKRALKLWIVGRTSQADAVIDQLRALYPTQPWPWFIRFAILALTGRAQAAQVMLDADPKMMESPQETSLWRTSLAALGKPSPVTIAKARDACVNAVKASGFGGASVMILSALGQVDTAFEVTEGFLLSKGSVVRRDLPGAAYDAASRINIQWLFTPPAAVMRADPRFIPLCEAVGLTDYWRARGVSPDYQLARR